MKVILRDKSYRVDGLGRFFERANELRRQLKSPALAE